MNPSPYPLIYRPLGSPGLFHTGLLACLLLFGLRALAQTTPSVVGAEVVSEVYNGSDLDVSVATTQLLLPNGPLDETTVNPTNVKLFNNATNVEITGTSVNTTGGGDAIVLTGNDLAFNTTYRLEIGSGIQDVTGASMDPFTYTFTTTGTVPPPSNLEFTQQTVASGAKYTCLAIGPDGKLYGLVNNGLIHRWDIATDGTLSNQQVISSLQTAEGGSRLAIHLVFHPTSSANNLIAYVSHTSFGFNGQPDWEGKITELSGADLQNVQDYVINLPRSIKDHVTNGLDFGPDGALYALQGSNTAMGAPDNTWGNRPERLLTAAVLRIDLNAITPPLDVQTEAPGTYDPFAPGAPVTIFGSGTRNPYDLVWHSNGQLYVPNNGSAAGGNTPATPSPLSAVPQRIDGAYTGGAVPAINGVTQTQNDLLFRVVQGGYYGHPNPLRGEYVMNGGNPTNGNDLVQVNQYPVGTLTDPNYRGIAYNFANNKSPNGVIEYTSNTFGGALTGKLLVVRYSGSDDIIVLTPGGTNQDIIDAQEGILGFTGFSDPLDLVENPATGDIYVAEYGSNEITLLRPTAAGLVPVLAVDEPEVIFSGFVNPPGSLPNDQQTATLRNAGVDPLDITALGVSGTDAAAFSLVNGPTLPLTLNSGDSLVLTLEFDPATTGDLSASLDITSTDGNNPTQSLPLYGLASSQFEGSNEPPMSDIVATLGYDINLGWTGLTTNINTFPLGDEVLESVFQKAGSGPVEMLPVARYSPAFLLPFGYYEDNDDTSAPTLTTVATLASGQGGTTNPDPEHQTLFPAVATGNISFDPGSIDFGFFTTSPSHTAYSEDALNALLEPSQAEHAVRIYALNDRLGNPVPNTYLVGFEEASNGDYQDYVFVVSNIEPASADTVIPPPPPPPAVGGILYRETFWNSDGSGNQPLASIGWAGYNTGSGTLFGNFIRSNSPGKPAGLDIVNAIEPDPSTAKVDGLLAAFSGPAPYFAFTEEYSIDLGTTRLDTVRWWQGHASASLAVRFAVRIAGQWYASNQTFTNTALGSVSDFANADPGGAQEQELIFSTAAADWVLLDFTAGSTLSLSSAAPTDLSGSIEAFGLYADGANATFRADNLTLLGGPDTTAGPTPNVAPIVANPILDQGAPVGVAFSYSIPANTFSDSDGSIVLPYAVASNGGALPIWLSFDPATSTFSGTPGAGDLGQVQVEVTATDDSAASVSDTFLIDVAVPPNDCNPLSTLPCSDLLVSVATDYCLNWDADEGGLDDNAGVGLGFTMAMEPSSPLAADLPLDPIAPGYQPAKLSVSGGLLTLTATQGIPFKDPSQSNNTNSLINGLGVAFDANQSTAYTIETSLSNVPAPGSGQFQQAGLWFGLDEATYVKLVIISNSGGGAYNVELLYEENEIVAAGDDPKTANTPVAIGADVLLRMEVDPATNVVVGSFSLDGGSTFTTVGTVTVSSALLSGITLPDGLTGPVSFAGVHASTRNSTTPLDFGFDSFCIDVADPVGTATLDGSLTLQGRIDYDLPVTVEWYQSGSLVGSANVTTDVAGNFSVPGLPAGSYEVKVKAETYLATVQSLTLVAGNNGAGFGEQLGGDANGDNFVNSLDFTLLAASFNLSSGDASFDTLADFNDDGSVSSLDFSLLSANFNASGEEPSGL